MKSMMVIAFLLGSVMALPAAELDELNARRDALLARFADRPDPYIAYCAQLGALPILCSVSGWPPRSGFWRTLSRRSGAMRNRPEA